MRSLPLFSMTWFRSFEDLQNSRVPTMVRQHGSFQIRQRQHFSREIDYGYVHRIGDQIKIG
jgi:hypothetical protein